MIISDSTTKSSPSSHLDLWWRSYYYCKITPPPPMFHEFVHLEAIPGSLHGGGVLTTLDMLLVLLLCRVCSRLFFAFSNRDVF